MVIREPPARWKEIREKILDWDNKEVLSSAWDAVVAFANQFDEIPSKSQWDKFVILFFESPSTSLRMDSRWEDLSAYMLKDSDYDLTWSLFD